MTSPQIANSWFLTGPTAAGKSAVGVELARRIGAEIISMDSMALSGHGHRHGEANTSAAREHSAPPDRRDRTVRRVQPGPVP